MRRDVPGSTSSRHRRRPAPRAARRLRASTSSCVCSPLVATRDLERERRPRPVVPRYPDSPSHLPDELVANVEAETRASDPARHLRVEACELLEDALPVLFRDPDSLVLDREAYAITQRMCGDLDAAAPRRVLDGVVDEVR